MRHGERRHNGNQGAQFSERDHQAEEEKQVIRAVENVQESGADKARGSLIPTWIQTNQSRIALEFKRADGPVGQDEA